MNEEQFLYLTTTGHKTGIPREIEIWFTQLKQRYYLIAEHNEKAKWVQNILHQPRISFRISNQTFNGSGRIVNEATEYELLKSVRALSKQKYGWSDGLVVELTADE
jgi:deazaflavin-dependent oxidoreductase (nitroreductase family)